jgi:hypothetical protein
MSMTHIPTNLCFVLHNPRESKPLPCLAVAGEEDFSSPAVGDHAALFCRVANHQPASPDSKSVCVTSARGRPVLGPIF